MEGHRVRHQQVDRMVMRTRATEDDPDGPSLHVHVHIHLTTCARVKHAHYVHVHARHLAVLTTTTYYLL